MNNQNIVALILGLISFPMYFLSNSLEIILALIGLALSIKETIKGTKFAILVLVVNIIAVILPIGVIIWLFFNFRTIGF